MRQLYMQDSRRRGVILRVISVVALNFVAWQCFAIQFIPLSPGYIANDVSGDGSTVIGDIPSNSAFRWTANRGFEVLNGLGSAAAITFDGAKILGQTAASSQQTAIWSENGLQVIPNATDTPILLGRGISSDGQVVVGYAYSSTLNESFRWDANTGLELFSNADEGTVNSANAISSDGKLIVGDDGSLAYLWTRETGLRTLPTAMSDSAAWGVSDDGSVIVGSINDRAFRWTNATGIQLLGQLPGLYPFNRAWDVTPDGSTIVGESRAYQGSDAFIWTEKTGMQSLTAVLTAGGIDLDGWQLGTARGISDNGMVIVGSGTNPQGQTEAWVIILPEPTTFTIAAMAVCCCMFDPCMRAQRRSI